MLWLMLSDNCLPMRTIFLLVLSNIFMTLAWYGHLKHTNVPLWKAILVSWGIAFFEYCLQVPANRLGYLGGFSAYQLKILQEAITLLVFVCFAIWYLREPFQWKYLISFFFLVGAVYFAFKK
jgi:uncharacterized protein (DUF486 family)